MQDEEEAPRPHSGFALGDDLTRFSVVDLDELADALRAEIERVKAERARKSRAIGGAEALFGGD